MRRRWPELLLGALALTAGYFAYADWQASRPRFSFEASEFVLFDLPTGEARPLEYRVHNMTGNVMRVVGAEYT